MYKQSVLDRQSDRQTKHVCLTKLHGWKTLAKIKNNRCRKGHPINTPIVVKILSLA